MLALSRAQLTAIVGSDLSPAAKLILVDLRTRANRVGIVNVSPDVIAERTRLSRRAVYQGLDAIAAGGYAEDLAGAAVRTRTNRQWRLASKVLAPQAGRAS